MELYDSMPAWVILVGAGASVEAGYPLYKDITDEDRLRKRFARFLPPNKHAGQELWKAIIEKDEVLSRFLSVDSYPAEREFARLFSRCAEISKRQTHFEQYLRELAINDPDALQSALDYYHDVLTVPDYYLNTNSAEYLRLFLRLKVLLAPVRIIVISFNHDLLIERSMNWKFYYGGPEEMAFRSCTAEQNAMEPLTVGTKHFTTTPLVVSVIKLHGSLNWIKCKHCGLIVYSNVPLRLSNSGFGWIFRRVHPCPKCRQRNPWDTTLVPPTTQKDIEQVAVFWEAAKKAMSDAAFITIAGYSFPEYDLDAWGLLNAIGNCGGVEIIEPYPSIATGKISSELSQRGISCILHQKTVKEYTRWQTEQFYGVDPFPNDCEEYQGPSQLNPMW